MVLFRGPGDTNQFNCISPFDSLCRSVMSFLFIALARLRMCNKSYCGKRCYFHASGSITNKFYPTLTTQHSTTTTTEADEYDDDYDDDDDLCKRGRQTNFRNRKYSVYCMVPHAIFILG